MTHDEPYLIMLYFNLTEAFTIFILMIWYNVLKNFGMLSLDPVTSFY